MENLIFKIGKYKGAKLKQIWNCDESYVCWFLSNVDIPKTELKKALNEINRLKN
tara:strand:+ start:536 stop:697 length:162 start_codon:yes stop_codon:yes gene_type:complete